MEITYKPGKENVVADWLSRAITVYAVEEEAGEPSGQFLREWIQGQEEEQNVAWEESSSYESSEEGRPIDMEELEDIINDKRRQTILKTRTTESVKVECNKYGRSIILMIWLQSGVKNDQICKMLNNASKPGEKCHLCRKSRRKQCWQLSECGFIYGVPERISSDSGREFDNALIGTEMKDLDVIRHFNTPGHPKSRGGIERLHGTLSDHLRLYQVDQGLEPDVAMPKVIGAYNHSIHTVTGFSPFEILFGLRGHRRTIRARQQTERKYPTTMLLEVSYGKRSGEEWKRKNPGG
ncbi:uncharacterized protein [Halyomorpha halys]|uniref:uncharacterized protein n=1 Tax=Halyomorpha halys TaxID=286706 RepID=UPI0034D3040F